jgi:hypothetical protein
LAAAENGYHVLSRRELLKFIAAEDGTRAEEIQALLNLDSVEKLRRFLGTSQREVEQKVFFQEQGVTAAEKDIVAILKIPNSSSDQVLSAVNNLRAILGGGNVAVDSLSDSKGELKAPEGKTQSDADFAGVPRDIGQVTFSSAIEERILTAEGNLRRLVSEVSSDLDLQKALKQKQLIDLGLGAIADDPSHCPLCGVSWEPAKLKQHLSERHQKATRAATVQRETKDTAEQISRDLVALQSALPRLIKVADDLKKETIKTELTAWNKSWEIWLKRLDDALANDGLARRGRARAVGAGLSTLSRRNDDRSGESR